MGTLLTTLRLGSPETGLSEGDGVRREVLRAVLVTVQPLAGRRAVVVSPLLLAFSQPSCVLEHITGETAE